MIGTAAISTAQIQDAAITTAKIANLAVGTAQIASASITTALIADAAITTAKIGTLQVTTALIADLNVTTGKIATLAVTDAKINSLTANKLTAGTIDASVITGTNINATNICSGALSAIAINGGASFVDTLGTFYPVVINAAGNLTVNSSNNHTSSLIFHNTATSLTDMVLSALDYGGVQTLGVAPSSTQPQNFSIWDRTASAAAYGLDFVVSSAALAIFRRVAGTQTQIYAYPGDNWLGNITGNAKTFTADTANGRTIMTGTVTVTVVAGTTLGTLISFAAAFQVAPKVVCTITNWTVLAQPTLLVLATAIGTANFTSNVYNYGVSDSVVTFNYIAVGPA